MAEVKDSRVQFFNSESSFGSSSNISTSRIDFQCDQLVANTENIFQAVKTSLKPRSDLTPMEELKHITYRAKLLANDTIPICIGRLGKNNKKAHIQELNQCADRLNKLVANHSKLTNQDISYEDFYQAYGEYGLFNKKVGNRVENSSLKVGNRPMSPTYIIPEPDVVNIVNYVQASRANMTPKIKSSINSQRTHQQQKQIEKLQQEIIALKKQLKQKQVQKQNHEQQVNAIMNKRVLNFIKLIKQGQNEKILLELEEKMKGLSESYQKEVKNNNYYRDQIKEKDKLIQVLTDENQTMRQLLTNNVKANSSRISDKSNYNESNLGENGGSDNRLTNLQKINRNLQYEVNKQKDLLLKLSRRESNSQQNQVGKLRKINEKKSKEMTSLLTELDRYQVENIRLADKLQKSEKSVQLVKLKAKSPNGPIDVQRSPDQMKTSYKDSSRLDESRTSKASKTVIQEYIGDGNEQYPYYELLNKQFRIRFRRACLKQKELLYKASGLEIGVITQYVKPNQLKQCLYLSNFCDKQVIKNLKLKLTNSKNNRTQMQINSYQKLETGEQVKNYISCQIGNYPIGCTVLICEYDYYSKHEEIRVLLPINVFRMLSIMPRDGNFDDRYCTTDNFVPQRKIVKDMEGLANYFKGGRVNKNVIECTIHHDHTNTRFFYDISIVNGQIEVQFEHKFGDPNLSQYIIKSISFLLRKQQGL